MGTGRQRVPLDSTNPFQATVIDRDGTVYDIEVIVIQTASGDVFVNEVQNNGTLDDLRIESIELTAVNDSNGSGMFANQSFDNTTVCFMEGTLIMGSDGAVALQDLSVGAPVLTRDHGMLPVTWMGGTTLVLPRCRVPIRIAPGSLGPDQPARRLRVSPQHRVWVRSAIAKRLFGTPKVVIAARHLLHLPGVVSETREFCVRYWHILLDRHALVRANGCGAETRLPGPQAVPMMGADARAGVGVVLCGLPARPWTPVRLIPKGSMQKQLIARQARNSKPLVPAAMADPMKDLERAGQSPFTIV